MKKTPIFIIMFIIMLCDNQSTFAACEFSAEILDFRTEPLVSSEQLRLPEVNGVKYVQGGRIFTGSHALLYDEKAYQLLGDSDVIWTGEYYMKRYTTYDDSFPGKAEKKPVEFYDTDLNLVAEHTFDWHIGAIGYSEGVYYCQIAHSNKGYKSTDMINWEETSEAIPRRVGNNICRFDKNEKNISISESDFSPIIYQNQYDVMNGMQFGNWSIQWGKNKLSFLLSNDNVYFVEVKFPEELCADVVNYNYSNTRSYVYEYGDNLVIDLQRNGYSYEGPTIDPAILKEKGSKVVRLTIPKQIVYNELEQQKGAPYIMLRNTILGFEQPPVMEAERTLVPMRFLFEQMDKDVEWNQETQTATVKADNTIVAFSINNDTATINNEEKIMDVPARLINGNTMIPVRFLSENLGYAVEWDAEHGIVKINESI